MSRTPLIVLLAIALGGLSGCYTWKAKERGEVAQLNLPREVDPSDINLPPGYEIEVVARNLTFPTAITFDEQGRPYVIEAGYSYGEYWGTPKLLRINPDGTTTLIARGHEAHGHAPWTGVVFHNGAFYVAQGGELGGGRIVRITMDGEIHVIIGDLPTVGDHHTNGPAIHNGYIYFGLGTATNSGVVGMDNFAFGWPYRYPDFHDIPARDITLTGRNFTTPNPLTEDPNDKAVTGAYVPFGTRTHPGQVIEGHIPASGTIMRIPLGGGELELVAWGLRNPYGLAFSPDGVLYVTENSYDVRGSRPIWGTGDVLWRIEPGPPVTWYGWPDFYAGRPITIGQHFAPPGGDFQPRFLLAEHPNEPPEPVARLGVHSSANGLDFSTSETFGHVGDAFIALFGDMTPGVGTAVAPVGYKVIRVDVSTGLISDFAINKGPRNGPASLIGGGGLERPNDAQFSPDGSALYIVDFGVMTIADNGDPFPRPETGVIWRIYPETENQKSDRSQAGASSSGRTQPRAPQPGGQE